MSTLLNHSLKVSRYLLASTFLLSSLASNASPLMTKAQYADYSVAFQCAEIQFHDDLDKKEAALIKIEDKYGLNDDNFDEFDELVTDFERDDNLLDDIRQRVTQECVKTA